MAVHSKASLTAAWAAKAATGAILDPDVLELHDVIAVGGALVFPLPTDGSSTSVQVGQTWTVLNPWTVAVPASGKGVTCSTSTGIMTIETNGDGWYLCRLKLNGSIAGIVQECELAMRAMRSSTYYMIQGERIDTPGVMTHLSPEAPGRLGGASALPGDREGRLPKPHVRDRERLPEDAFRRTFEPLVEPEVIASSRCIKSPYGY